MNTNDAGAGQVLLGWAFRTEMACAGDLKSIDRLSQLPLSSDELERIDRFFGVFVAAQCADSGDGVADVLVRTPGLTLASLYARASRVVEPSSLFAEYLGGLGLAAEEDDAAAVAELVVPLLTEHGLTVPAELDDPVHVLLWHAGITGAAIARVLELVDAHEDAQATVAALAEDEDYPATAHIAATCGERIEEIVERILALRAFIVDNRGTWRVRRAEWPEPRLPQLIEEAVVAEYRERPVGTAERYDAVGVSVREMRPRLVLDLPRRKVCVRLPEQKLDGHEEVQWRLAVDGTTRVYRTSSPRGTTSPYSEILDVTVAQATREVMITDVNHDLEWVTAVVDSADPLIVFAPGGASLNDKVSLHYPELFAVCPDDARLYDVIAERDHTELERFPIDGWEGWSARRLDTSDASSLKLVRDGDSVTDNVEQVRCIDPRQRVVFAHPADSEIPFVESTAGLPVHNASLVAEFPATVSGDTEYWYLSIAALAGLGEEGELVAGPEALEIPAEGGAFDIFDPEAWDTPWVGEYLIRLRGPRNESFRHRYAIVEGMTTDVVYDGICQSFRIPGPGGLTGAGLNIYHDDKTFDVSPRRITVAPDAAATDLTITTDAGDQLPLRFSPPQLLFELPLANGATGWRSTRLAVRPNELAARGELKIRLPRAIGDPRVSVRNQHGTPMRNQKLVSRDGGTTYSAPMAAIAASATAVMTGRIELEWVDKVSDKRVSVRIVDLVGVPAVTGVELDGGELVVTGARDATRLGAWVWLATAPWALGTTLRPIGERTALPESLVDAGDLLVQIFVDDPFAAMRAPQAPSSSAVTLSQPGYYTAQREGWAQLSAFFAGETEDTPTDPTIFPLLWDYVAAEVPVAHKALVANPEAALRGLSESLVPARLQPGRIIASGLVFGDFAGEAVGGDVSELHRSPWISALQLLAGLPAVFDSEDATSLRAIRSQLTTVAGKNAVNTLATGRDTTLDSACIDASTVQIAQMPPAQQQALLDMFFKRSEIVPGAIMDDTTRLLAVFAAFDQREQLGDLLTEYDLIPRSVKLLRALRGANRGLYNAANVRFDKLDGVDTEDPKNRWALAPVVSIVFALAARMRAHGQLSKTQLLDESALAWSKLADLVPDLVTGDLIAAEAMVLAEVYAGR
ncbi:hypothetical protein [Corynebacterium uterequi]|uniref:Uncharacterized protein n=1 Tax=Corynebacterium uterequi TaxID=1072256 RepID=A0A0G3HDD2_9CORY|nr:hypothetical protein [Corynebacterium uterequi]AKK11391.1 hypothetical protein CUTER_07010 [Corynebacterium uterequi]